MAVIQRLEIYGLFTDVVVVFCASYADSPPPLDIKFSFAAKKGNHFAPRKISSRNTTTHTHTQNHFFVWVLAEMSGNRNRISKATKIDQNFILSIKFVKRAKNTLFCSNLNWHFKRDVQNKIHSFMFNNLRKTLKSDGSVPLVSFRQNLEFSNFTNSQKRNKKLKSILILF